MLCCQPTHSTVKPCADEENRVPRRTRAAYLTICILAVAVCVGSVVAIRSGALTPTDDYLKTRFTDARSRFIEVQGVPMHVVEEGRGPVIVLIHGYLASHRQWDGWADTLRKDFRVVRFDYPPFGLSDPDPTTHEVFVCTRPREGD